MHKVFPKSERAELFVAVAALVAEGPWNEGLLVGYGGFLIEKNFLTWR